MKIFVSAAEISSDIHAEKILKSLHKKLSEKNILVEWMGIGGPRVTALPGFRSIESAENLRTMGFVEVLKKYGFFKKLISRAADEIKVFNPDLILTFDYPDFHLRLMNEVKINNLAPSALRVCGIPPKVWVWRSKRVEKIRNLYHGVWVIFPFEKKFYESHGIPVIYEGNPLLEDLFLNDLLKNKIKKPLETITVMPGSRDAELKYHLPVIPKTLELFAVKVGKKITAQVPIPSGVDSTKIRNFLINSSKVEYRFIENGSISSLSETQIGLIKSGTSTLEASVLNCLPVIFYKMNWFSEQIFRWFIKGWGGYLGPVGLPNILLGIKKREDSLFREFLGPEATPERLSHSLYEIYENFQQRNSFLEQCNSLRDLFFLNQDSKQASDKSAEQILGWKRNPNHLVPIQNKKKSFLIFIVSILWSSLNWFRRRLYRIGLFHSYPVKTPSVLVGNLQAGGAGKTPVVIALAKEAVSRGLKVAVVSRGYGSTVNNPLGDEPQEIKNEVPQVRIYVGPDRLKSIKEAENNGAQILLFDDGFQNLKFKAAVNLIAVTDRSRSEIPYRDFDTEIAFADMVVGTKGKVFREVFSKSVPDFFKLEWEWDNPISKPIWLLCAIADPVELIGFYRERGLVIKNIILKPDHSEFNEEEVKKLMIQAIEDGAVLAVTKKDRVKIPTHFDDIYILTRSMRNRDWIDAVFESKLLLDESP